MMRKLLVLFMVISVFLLASAPLVSCKGQPVSTPSETVPTDTTMPTESTPPTETEPPADETTPPTEPEPPAEPFGITVDLSNVALIGTAQGLNIIDERGLSDFEEYSLLEVLDGVVDDSGKLWYVRSGGISTYDGKSWETPRQPHGVYTFFAITIDQGGRVWVGHYNGVSVLEGEQWHTYSSDTFGLGEYAGMINDIAVDHQNRVWVATSAGVAFLTGETWTPYDESNGLTDNYVEAVLIDHQGKV